MAMSDADRAKAAVKKLLVKRDKLQKELTEVIEVLASLGIGEPIQTISKVTTTQQTQKKGSSMADVDPMLDTIPTFIKEETSAEDWDKKQIKILNEDNEVSSDGDLSPADNMGAGRWL